jgi:hypothetical protein
VPAPSPLLATALYVLALAGEPPPRPTAPPPSTAGQGDDAEIAQEPEGGIGVSPVELIPRLELRQTYSSLAGSVAIHDTTLEVDIEFLKRLLLRYQVPVRLMETPTGQVTGIGDIQVGLIALLASNARLVVAAVAGAELNTATKAQLGAGKQQLILGLGAAVKPFPWWLAYLLAQQQFSIAGESARQEVNQTMIDLGSILFGRQFNWLKFDLISTVDFPGGPTGRLYGQAEAGSLVVGRVGLYMRVSTQLAGPRLLDYALTGGIRYLFRLETSRPR